VDGVYYQIISCDYGAKLTALEDPKQAGYSFSGWSPVPDTMPDSDVTITGSFSINSYYLIYKVDGAEYQRFQIQYGAPITALEAPAKEGYIFEGWSAVPSTMPAGDVEVLGTFTKKPRELQYISVTSLPYKDTQPVQGLFFNPAGMEITAAYDDGSTVVIEVTNALINGGTVQVEPGDFIKTGAQPVTVTYQGKSDNFTLTVVPKSVTGIAISTQPDKVEYFRGDTLSLSGGEICVSYNNDTQSYIDMTASSVSLSGYNADKLGIQAVTLTYTDTGGHKFTALLTVAVDPLAGTPSSPKAAANSYNSVKITWSAVSDASGYAIYRSASSTGNFIRIASLTQTSYINQPLTMGSTYYYKIFAYKTVNGANSYGYASSIVSAKPLPPAPASPKAVSASYNSIKISWTAVNGATGYAVYRSDSATGTFTKLTALKTTYYMNQVLPTGKTFYYKIQAYRTENGKNTYGPSSTIAFAKTVPAVPGSPKAAPVPNTGIKISWSAVPGASGYVIYRSDSGPGNYEKLTAVKLTSYTDKSVMAGETYFYTVQAYTTVKGVNVYGGSSSAVYAGLSLT
jgi:fibronectin type 3 domain-containing protein